MLAGLLNYEYACWLCFWVVLGSIIGLIKVNKLVKETGRQSIIVIILAIMISASTIVMPLFGMLRVFADKDKGIEIWAISDLC